MNDVVGVASQIRTNTGAKLLRDISLDRMQNSLLDLFMDRNKQDKVNLLADEDGIRKVMRYSNCLHLNDARTIEFCNSFKQADDVFDEKRQIWIDRFIDTEKDDLFIPRDDSND